MANQKFKPMKRGDVITAVEINRMRRALERHDRVPTAGPYQAYHGDAFTMTQQSPQTRIHLVRLRGDVTGIAPFESSSSFSSLSDSSAEVTGRSASDVEAVILAWSNDDQEWYETDKLVYVANPDPADFPWDEGDVLSVYFHQQSGRYLPLPQHTIRHAVTVDDEDGYYPTEAEEPDTYAITWVDVAYTPAAGRRLEVVTEKDGGPHHLVHNTYAGTDSYIPEGTVVPVFYQGGQWFTHVCAPYDRNQSSTSSSASSSSSSSSSSTTSSTSSSHSISSSSTLSSSSSSTSTSSSSSPSSSSNSSSSHSVSSSSSASSSSASSASSLSSSSSSSLSSSSSSNSSSSESSVSSSSSSGDDASQGLIYVSSNDTTLGYLNGKLVAGGGILLTENNNGGNETLTVAVVTTGVTSNVASAASAGVSTNVALVDHVHGFTQFNWQITVQPSGILLFTAGTTSPAAQMTLPRMTTTGTPTHTPTAIAEVLWNSADSKAWVAAGATSADWKEFITSVSTGASLPAHVFLSAQHSDTLTGTVVRGGMIVGNATPKWALVTIGAANTVWRSDGTDPGWSTGDLDSNARVGVRKNSAGSTFTRRRVNLIEGSGITLTVADDSGNEEVDVTIEATAGGGGTVTSVDVSGGTTGLTTSGGPITTSGTITISGTLIVANGGTGRASHTAYAVICGGTTSTAAQQSIASVGTAAQVLTSNGAGALPTFQDVPVGSITGLAEDDWATGDFVPFYDTSGTENNKGRADKLAGLFARHTVDGRLTVTSGTPVTTANASGTTLYYTPYCGNRVAIYDGTRWIVHNFSEISLALTLTSGNVYDVWLYDNAGTLTLETLVWTNATTRATELAYQDGVLVKTGATTRRYLGTLRATNTDTAGSSTTARVLWNYYNRVPMRLMISDNTNSWTSTDNAWHQFNSSGTNQFDIVIGVADSVVQISATAAARNSSAGVQQGVGIGIDSTSANSADLMQNNSNPVAGAGTQPAQAFYANYLAVGLHTIAMLERAGATGTSTFFGDAGDTYMLAGMIGIVWG